MTLDWKILDPDVDRDRQSWTELWWKSPMQHPFAHPEVCRLLGDGTGRLMAATMADGSGHVLYPFIVRAIEETEYWPLSSGASARSDIISPYGYGGPLHWGLGDVKSATQAFWEEFDAWARTQSIVSEFVRFSLFQEDLLPYPGPTRARQTNYVRDLDVPPGDLWEGLEPKVRRNVRRARREGVRIIVDGLGDHLEDFLRIYLGTMERRASAEWYRFDRSFFTMLHAALPGRFAYVLAQLDGEIVSADLLLLGADTGYYFLGGTEESSFGARPNDLVKVEAMDWLRTTGRRRYVIGGGVRSQDGLERYKRGFAPRGAVDFSTGERIISPQCYDSLEADLRRRFSEEGLEWDETDDFFPAYRRKVPAPLTTVGGMSP